MIALSNDVLRSILQFVTEVELYAMEETYPDAIITNVSGPQWNYLNQRDVARGTNRRWKDPPTTLMVSPQPDDYSIQQQQQQEQTDVVATASTRDRGREYAQSLIFVRNCADEARHYFDFDRDCVSADEIPVHCNGDNDDDDDDVGGGDSDFGSIIMPLDYWREWIHFDDVLTEYNNNDDGQGGSVGDCDNALNENITHVDVFLELSFSRGSNNKSDSDSDQSCWRGFRKARLEGQQDNNNNNNYLGTHFTMSLKLELDPLVKEMGWTEIKDFRDESQDYRLCHFDVSNTQKKMKSLMKNMQLTIVHVASGRLLVATGGYASPDTTHRRDSNIFAKDANVARFHCRHDRYPIVEPTTTTTDTMEHHPFRFSFLRIPTLSNTDQSMEIIIKTQ